MNRWINVKEGEETAKRSEKLTKQTVMWMINWIESNLMEFWSCHAKCTSDGGKVTFSDFKWKEKTNNPKKRVSYSKLIIPHLLRQKSAKMETTPEIVSLGTQPSNFSFFLVSVLLPACLYYRFPLKCPRAFSLFFGKRAKKTKLRERKEKWFFHRLLNWFFSIPSGSPWLICYCLFQFQVHSSLSWWFSSVFLYSILYTSFT
jgi:hypothetical protein